MLDYILLPRETRNLSKINKLADKVNISSDIGELAELRYLFLKIKTTDHKNKIDFFISFIDIKLWQQLKLQYSLKGKRKKKSQML